MYNPNHYEPFPLTEEEWLHREEQLDRFERLREIERENNGEFRDVDPETGCTAAEETAEPKPAGSAYQPMQMELFSRKEVA